MDIGTGIAIAGIWIFAGCGWASSDISNGGKWIALIASVTITTIIL